MDELLYKYIKSKNRIKHLFSTAETMKKYANDFSFDKEKAYFVGLYHDVGKELPNEEIVLLVNSFLKRNLFEIRYLDFKLKYPNLLHGVASAEILINEMSINDMEIIEAIICHTSGGIGLKDFSKFVYVVDYCEPLRSYETSKKIYKILTKEKDLLKAYFYTYCFRINDLVEKNKVICLETIDGYNDALKLYYKI